MTTLNELAERCEKATGGGALELINLECDIRVALAIKSALATDSPSAKSAVYQKILAVLKEGEGDRPSRERFQP